MHSYIGSKEIAQSLLKLNENFYFSLSLGILNVYIYYNQKLEMLDYIPIDNLILETDSPHQFNKSII